MAYGIGGSSPEDLPRYVKDIDFPATRGEILLNARQHHADPDMLDKIEHLPDREFSSIAQVIEEYRNLH